MIEVNNRRPNLFLLCHPEDSGDQIRRCDFKVAIITSLDLDQLIPKKGVVAPGPEKESKLGNAVSNRPQNFLHQHLLLNGNLEAIDEALHAVHQGHKGPKRRGRL